MTNNPNRTAKTILQYEVDRSAIARTQSSIDTIRRAMKTLDEKATESSKIFEDMGQQLKTLERISAIDDITRSMADLSIRTGRAQDDVERLAAVLKEVGASEAEIKRAALAFNSYVNAQNSNRSGGAERLGRGLGTVERLAGGLGVSELNQGLGIAGDALDVGQALAGAEASLGAVAAIAVPAAAGIAAVAGAFDLARRNSEALVAIEQKRQELNAVELARRQSNVEAAKTLSSAGLDAFIDTLEQQVAITEDELARREKELEKEVRKRFTGPGVTGEILRDQIENLKKTDEEYQNLLAKRGDETAAIGNADKVLRKMIEKREAEERAIQAQIDASTKAIDEISSRNRLEAEASRLLRTSSSEAIKERVTALQDEMQANKDTRKDIIQNVKDGKITSEVAGEVLAELNKQYGNQRNELNMLLAVLPKLKFKELANDAVAASKTLNAARDTLKDLFEQQKRNAVLDQRARTESELEKRIADAKALEDQQEQTDKTAEIRADAYKEEQEAIRQYMTDEIDANRDFQDEIGKITRDGQREILDILENFNDRAVDAVFQNDVKAFVSAQRQRDRALRDQRQSQDNQIRDAIDNFNKQSAERARSYAEELRQIRMQLDERLRAEQEAGQKRISQAERLEAELAAKREQWSKEDATAQRRARDQQLIESINTQSKIIDQAESAIEKAILDPLRRAGLITNSGPAALGSSRPDFSRDSSKTPNVIRRSAGSTNVTNIYINGTKTTVTGSNQSKVVAAARAAALVFQNQLGA